MITVHVTRTVTLILTLRDLVVSVRAAQAILGRVVVEARVAEVVRIALILSIRDAVLWELRGHEGRRDRGFSRIGRQ